MADSLSNHEAGSMKSLPSCANKKQTLMPYLLQLIGLSLKVRPEEHFPHYFVQAKQQRNPSVPIM